MVLVTDMNTDAENLKLKIFFPSLIWIKKIVSTFI